jgi:hypothetical protein
MSFTTGLDITAGSAFTEGLDLAAPGADNTSVLSSVVIRYNGLVLQAEPVAPETSEVSSGRLVLNGSTLLADVLAPEVAQLGAGRIDFKGSVLQVDALIPEAAEIVSGSVVYKGSALYAVVTTLLGGVAYEPGGQGTADWYYLSDDLDTYASNGWPPGCSAIDAGEVGATFSSNVPVSSATFAITSGHRAHAYMDDYYYRVHISPNPIDFGSVLSAQTRSVEVWNAWTTEQLLSAVTPDGASGVNLVGPEAPPTTFAANEFRLYSLVVDLDGPVTINAGFTFEFPSQTTRLALSGSRVTVFPIAPNWKTPVLERLEWLTDLLEMRDGSEQRIRLRQNPRQSIEYEILAIGNTVNLLQSLLFGWQGRTWALPLWFHAQQLTTGVTANATTLPCVTAGYEFQQDGYVMLYLSETIYEVVRIAAISGSSLTSVVEVSRFWPAGSWIIPIRMSRIKDDITLQYINGEVATCVVRFWSEQTLAIPSTWAAGYLGKPVLEVEPNRVSNMAEQWTRKTTLMDNGVGPSYTVDKLDFSKTIRSHTFTALNRTQIKTYRNLFYYAQGRWKEFWSPTYNRDMRLTEDVHATQDWLVINSIQYSTMVNSHSMRRHIRLALNTGQVYYRRIESSDDVNTPSGTEKLFLDAALPVEFSANAVVISFMTLSRMDTDTLEISWRTLTVADTTAQIKGVLA